MSLFSDLNCLFSVSEKMKSRSHAQFCLVLVTLVTIVTISAYPNRLPKLPCEKCDTDLIHPWRIKMMSPICGPCGDLFGLGYEYCCICHEDFRLSCDEATRGPPL